MIYIKPRYQFMSFLSRVLVDLQSRDQDFDTTTWQVSFSEEDRDDLIDLMRWVSEQTSNITYKP